MDVYRTEEEQIEAIKKWWQEYGVTVIVAVLLAVAVYGGWTWYRHAKLEAALNASQTYQAMSMAAEEAAAAGPGSDAAQRQQRAASEIVDKYGNTAYAPYAALVLARVAADAEDYASAEKHLRTALDKGQGEAFKSIVTDRLARVISAQGKHDDALALIAGSAPEGLVAQREETRGDILLAQGKRAEAKAAWEKALAAMPEKAAARGLVQLKLDYVAGE